MPPANNLFANRTVIGAVPYTIAAVDNTGCIEEVGDPLFLVQGDGTLGDASAGFKHLWWEFTPAVTQNYLIEVSDSSPSFGIFTGSALGALTEVASWFGRLTIRLEAGVTYQLCVIAFNSSSTFTTDFTVTATPTRPLQQVQTAREITSWPFVEEFDGALLTDKSGFSASKRQVFFKTTITEESYFSFWVHKGTGATTINPSVRVYGGTSTLNIFDGGDAYPPLFNWVGVNYPGYVPLMPGTYYFEATYFNATPIAQNIAIEVLKFAQPASIPAGAIIIQDDRGVEPASAIDPNTCTFLGFVPGIPSGEHWYTDEASGKTLMENAYGGDPALYYPFDGDPEGFTLFNPDWTKVWSFGVAHSESPVGGNNAGKFYVANITPHPSGFSRSVKSINLASPAFDGGSWTVDTPALMDLQGMAVSPDETTLYYSCFDSGLTAERAVRRWNLTTDSALPDLATSATYQPTREILVMADGTILVAWWNYPTITDFVVHSYDPSGTLLNTIDLVECDSLEIRMWHDPDPTIFWIWTKQFATGHTSVFRKVRASDFTVLQTCSGLPFFVSGLIGSSETVSPAARFGHSLSCSGMMSRATIFPGAAASPSPSPSPSAPEIDEDGTIGPLVWVEWPRRVPALEVS